MVAVTFETDRSQEPASVRLVEREWPPEIDVALSLLEGLTRRQNQFASYEDGMLELSLSNGHAVYQLMEPRLHIDADCQATLAFRLLLGERDPESEGPDGRGDDAL